MHTSSRGRQRFRKHVVTCRAVGVENCMYVYGGLLKDGRQPTELLRLRIEGGSEAQPSLQWTRLKSNGPVPSGNPLSAWIPPLTVL